MSTLPETAELETFVRTVDARSLTRAAAELQLPRTTLSRRLSRLEEKLRVRLLRRTTRSLTLTDAGEQFYGHARTALAAIASAQTSVQQAGHGELEGPLRISVPPGFGVELQRLVLDFVRRHPRVRLHLLATSDVADFAKDGFDLALRAASTKQSGVITRTLREDLRFLVASPKYLERHGTPRTVKDLKSHRCLLTFGPDRLPNLYWPRLDGGKVRVEPALVTNDVMLLYGATLAGQGIALIPEFLARLAIEKGKLVRVLPSVGTLGRLVLAWPEREFMPPQVRALVDELIIQIPKIMDDQSLRQRLDQS